MMWVSSEIISDGQVTVILERFKSAMRFLVDRPEESSYIEIISCQAGSRSLLSNVKMNRVLIRRYGKNYGIRNLFRQ